MKTNTTGDLVRQLEEIHKHAVYRADAMHEEGDLPQGLREIDEFCRDLGNLLPKYGGKPFVMPAEGP